jgi:hypothetical protein
VTPRRGAAWAAGVGGVLLAALTPLALLGLYVRPTSDDWCLIPLAEHGGFSAVVNDVNSVQNGRLGNGIVLGVLFVGYGPASKLLPGVMLVLLCLAFWVLWRQVLTGTRLADAGAAGLAALPLSAVTVIALLLAKPHRYQTLYHPPTIVSHTLPVLIALVIVVAVLALHRRRRGLLWASVVAFGGGLFLGTFNEAFTAVCLVSAVAAVTVWWLVPRHALHWRVVAAGAVGLLLGFVSVYFSPGSQNRQQLIHTRSLFDGEVWRYTAEAWWRVVTIVFTSGEGLLLVLVALVVGALLAPQVAVRPLARRVRLAGLLLPAVWALLASVAATFVLCYSFNAQLVNRERTWPSITVTGLTAVVWYGLLAGRWAGARLRALATTRARGLLLLALVGVPSLLVAGACAADLARDERDLTTITVLRARAWDDQQTALRRQVAAGETTLMVRPVPIDGLYEPFYPNRRSTWPAVCAPAFYGVDKVVPPPRARR